MNKRVVFLTLGVLVLIVAACAAPPTTAPPPPPQASSSSSSVAPTAQPTAAPTAGKPIKVGLLTDQTGSLAIYGPMQENGVRLGLEYATGGTNTINGRPIQLIVKDTASAPDVGTQAARDLIEKENVDVLFGPPSSGVALAVDELAKQYKKVIIHLAASPDMTGKGFNPYVFRTGRTSVQDALAMGAALTKMGKTFVQIAPDYAFGYAAAGAYYSVIKAMGGKFVINDTPEQNGAVYIPIDTKDLTPYLQRVIDSRADVLAVSWSGASIVPLMTQMQQLGVTKSMTVAIGFPDTPTLKAGYGGAVGWVGLALYHPTLPKNAINDWFVKRSKEKFNSYPDFPTEVGFTSAQMFVLGVKATNGDASADKLIAAYENGFSFDGPKGKYTVRPYDHVMLQTLYLVKLNNITDPDVNFYTLLQEVKPEDTAPPCALEGEYKSRCPTK